MTQPELDTVFAHQTAAIIAPAGHGKTEMIVDMVDYANGKQLLLTHTHAGVDALQKRLNRRKIPKTKYAISTIAAFCVHWGMSYFHTAEIDTSLSPYKTKTEARAYYSQFYTGVKQLFQHNWAGLILQSTYSGIIVDEYQDCLQIHHELFLEISNYLPVRVLGDPLQGIFSFSGQTLVNWTNLEFPTVNIKTSPWRWSQTNPALGQYLNTVRNYLWPTLSGQLCTINVDSCNGSIVFIDPQDFNLYSMLNTLRQYQSVLYLTKWEPQQAGFCLRHPGVFQLDEKQECEDLFKYSEIFSNNDGPDLMLTILEFESKCSTKVNSELNSYISRLSKGNFDFRMIKKHKEFGTLLSALQDSEKNEIILHMLTWFENNPTFKCYRKELHGEMIRSVKYAKEHRISIFEAAEHLRKDPSLQKRYEDFKYLSSRTLLSKGLEYDCVIIDMTVPLSAKEFYVAITRAMKKIFIVSQSSSLRLEP